MVYKNVIEIFNAISRKLSGQYVRFIAWFGMVLIYSMVWNGFDLQPVLVTYEAKQFIVYRFKRARKRSFRASPFDKLQSNGDA